MTALKRPFGPGGAGARGRPARREVELGKKSTNEPARMGPVAHARGARGLRTTPSGASCKRASVVHRPGEAWNETVGRRAVSQQRLRRRHRRPTRTASASGRGSRVRRRARGTRHTADAGPAAGGLLAPRLRRQGLPRGPTPAARRVAPRVFRVGRAMALRAGVVRRPANSVVTRGRARFAKRRRRPYVAGAPGPARWPAKGACRAPSGARRRRIGPIGAQRDRPARARGPGRGWFHAAGASASGATWGRCKRVSRTGAAAGGRCRRAAVTTTATRRRRRSRPDGSTDSRHRRRGPPLLLRLRLQGLRRADAAAAASHSSRKRAWPCERPGTTSVTPSFVEATSRGPRTIVLSLASRTNGHRRETRIKLVQPDRAPLAGRC